MYILSNNRSKVTILGATILQTIASTIILILSAKLSIPFYPVNFTLQTLAIGLNVALFGGRASLLGMMMYLSLGASGLPVFTSGGGIAYMFSASSGFILGLSLSAFIQSLKFSNTITRYIIGTTILYILGAIGLMLFGFTNVSQIIALYVPAELCKLVAFASGLHFIRKS